MYANKAFQAGLSLSARMHAWLAVQVMNEQPDRPESMSTAQTAITVIMVMVIHATTRNAFDRSRRADGDDLNLVCMAPTQPQDKSRHCRSTALSCSRRSRREARLYFLLCLLQTAGNIRRASVAALPWCPPLDRLRRN